MAAQYNLKTDEIEGCEPDTLIWWHERGHQVLEHKLHYHSFENWVIFNGLLIGLGACAYRLFDMAILIWWLIIITQLLGEVVPWLYAFWFVPGGLKHFVNDRRTHGRR